MKDIFTNRLKKSINERGLTQRMFATLIGTTEQSVSRWAKGNRTPNADMLYRMCKALDVSADYLLGLSDERANNMEKLKAELLDKIKKLWEENNGGKGKDGAVKPEKTGGGTEGGNQEVAGDTCKAKGICKESGNPVENGCKK